MLTDRYARGQGYPVGRRLRLHAVMGLYPLIGTRANTGEFLHVSQYKDSADTIVGPCGTGSSRRPPEDLEEVLVASTGVATLEHEADKADRIARATPVTNVPLVWLETATWRARNWRGILQAQLRA
jgi:hypothetical protein